MDLWVITVWVWGSHLQKPCMLGMQIPCDPSILETEEEEDWELEASLGYIATPSLNKTKLNQNSTNQPTKTNNKSPQTKKPEPQTKTNFKLGLGLRCHY